MEHQLRRKLLLQTKLVKSLDNGTGDKIKDLERELTFIKSLIAVCEEEHEGEHDVDEIKTELETLIRCTLELSASLRKRVTNHVMTREMKEQLWREVASLRDEIAALKISKETQQRQLTEHESTFHATKQQQQQLRTGKAFDTEVYNKSQAAR